MLQAGQYDGKQYMITCGGSTIMLWYNTELFEQAGLDPENPPKTWDEFKGAACEALSKIDGIDPFGLYAKSSGGETSFLFESLFTSEFGGSAWDSATNQYVYDSEQGKTAAVNTLQFIQDITQYAQDSYVEYGRFDVSHAATRRQGCHGYWTPSIWRTRCPTSWPTARFAAR